MLPTDGQIHFGNLKPGITGEGGTNGAFSLHSDGVTGNNYLQVASLPKPATTGACDYVVNFEARFVPDAGSATVPVGINIGDARGWAVTRSMIEIDRIGGEWKTFRALYHAEPDTAAITVQAHMDFGSAKISGRLEVRGFQIEALSAPRFPAYALLTACATLSGDGKTLHLIVFNKSTRQDIPARLRIAGFHAASARVWEVNGPSLSALDGVAETVHGAPFDMASKEPVHLFPAHSMTAIDFVVQAHP
jgi:alpha-N-arabinofuranosidase